MRDLIFSLMILGILVGLGCGVAQAQYKAQSPNYQLEEQSEPSGPAVGGEEDVQIQQTEQQTAPVATELPATNPPYTLIGAVIVGLALAVVVYFALK